MHPEISAWPSKTFYNNELLDDPSTSARFSDGLVNTGVRFVHTTSNESNAGNSYENYAEATFIVNDIAKKQRSFHRAHFEAGIICMYSAQVNLIRKLLNEIRALEIDVTCDTVDGFQGGEKDVIYISCVRSNTHGKVGFVDDPQRLNVAATRAKSICVFVGNIQTLSNASDWFRSLEHDLNQRRLIQSLP